MLCRHSIEELDQVYSEVRKCGIIKVPFGQSVKSTEGLLCAQVYMLNVTFQIIKCIRVRRTHVSICSIEHHHT